MWYASHTFEKPGVARKVSGGCSPPPSRPLPAWNVPLQSFECTSARIVYVLVPEMSHVSGRLVQE